jgi:L-alanine-DL-glutamate epimerase-like enolase superfamily enzyme
MRISRLETLFADAGWRRACYLKIITDDGVIGWSEYGEHFGTAGVTGVIHALGELVVGMDPLGIERIAALLKGRTIQAGGGVNQNAISAIVNALFDIKGKALGVPVHALFGGALRDRVPFYWSHIGTYRVRNHALLGVPPLKGYESWAALGEDARKKGVRAVKTGLVVEDGSGGFANIGPGFAYTPGWPELNLDRKVLSTLKKQLAALREGLGDDIDLMLDVNFHFKTEGFLEIVRAVEPYGLAWLELDTYDRKALSRIRSAARFPIASLEALYGRTGLRPFLEEGAADVAIIDLMWNGYLEASKMAMLAEAHEVNVSTHNYCGGLLSDVISAHYAAAIPNLRQVEFDVEDVPWKAEFLTGPLVVGGGDIVVPQGPGWGVEVNEAFVRSRPPR